MRALCINQTVKKEHGMALKIETLKGVKVTTAGAGISSVGTNTSSSTETYSYIELSNGSILRNVSTSGALDGILRTAIKDSETVDLHISSAKNNEILLMAIGTANGRNYAMDGRGFMPIAGLVYIMAPAIFLALLGLPFLLVFGEHLITGRVFSFSFWAIAPWLAFGVGLLAWWGAYKLFSTVGKIRTLTKYNEALPNVILLK
jgi:hypothetical protein